MLLLFFFQVFIKDCVISPSSSPSADHLILFLSAVHNVHIFLRALEDRHFIIVFVRTSLHAHTRVIVFIALGCAWD